MQINVMMRIWAYRSVVLNSTQVAASLITGMGSMSMVIPILYLTILEKVQAVPILRDL